MKTKEEIYQLLNSNPAFHLATVENQQPHVRGMLLYAADERGIIFHTGTFKSLYKQIVANPAVELCFNSFKTGEQVRVKGELVDITSPELMDEVYQHPTRGFLRAMGEEVKGCVAIYRVDKAEFYYWTMEKNRELTVFEAL